MCNHHDQNKVAAPSTYLAPPLYTGDYTIQSDPLSAHHTRLEALLDSALATLTLIRDYTPISPVLTFRSAEVLRALCRHASVPPTPTRDTTTPAPVPSPSPSPTPSSTPATYAEATTRTASDPVVSATADEPTPTHPVATVTADKPTPSHPVATVTADKPTPTHPQPKAPSPTPDLIFRFDHLHTEHNILVANRLHPARLFYYMEAKTIIGDLKLASIRWTTRGNLTLAFAHNKQFTMAEVREQVPHLWTFLRSILRLPETCPPVTVDHGGPWHNVVIHSVPVPHDTLDDGTLVISTDKVNSWLRSCGVTGDIKATSFMCSDDDLATCDNAPLRVSLSSQKDADMLVHSGALVLGSHCSVSRLSASAGPCASHSATHTPADVSIPIHFRGLCGPQRRPRPDVAIARRLDVPISPEWHFCSTQMPYNSSHRADVVLGVLFSRANAPPAHTTAHAALPAGARTEYEYLSALVTPALIVRPVSSPLAPMRPPPTPPSCGTPRLIAETSSPPVRRCLSVEACTRLQSSPSASAVVSSAGMKPIRILSPLCRAEQVTRPQDNDLVAGSINPPSLRVDCELPSLGVNSEALPQLRVNCDTPVAYTSDSVDTDGPEQRTPGATRSNER
ncbi:hypothetical protein K438DRAFT_2020813 [Mycena galopus ATCC 62051]|nr:hypothetical protein K438DRAFT_2020813 [Mycena galopus ATCC 62051]